MLTSSWARKLRWPLSAANSITQPWDPAIRTTADKNRIMGARKPRGRREKYLITFGWDVKAGVICHYTFTYFKSVLYSPYIEQNDKNEWKRCNLAEMENKKKVTEQMEVKGEWEWERVSVYRWGGCTYIYTLQSRKTNKLLSTKRGVGDQRWEDFSFSRALLS